MNGLGLLFLGRLIENVYGSARFLVIYICAGFAGGFASYTLSEAPLSAGASGAIFGLVGAGIAFLVFHGSRLPRRTRGTYLFLFLFVASADMVFGFKEEIIDMVAHLGGLLAGFFVGAILRPVLGSRRAPSPLRTLLVRAAAGIAVLLLGVCIVFAGVNYFTGARIPTSIPLRVVRSPDGRWTLPVPSHWESIAVGNDVAFRGTLIVMAVDEFPSNSGLSLADQALAVQEKGYADAERKRPFTGPRSWSPEGSEREFIEFRTLVGENKASRTHYTRGNGRLAVFTFFGPEGALDAFEGVIEKMLLRFQFIED
jgi:membrane associated rhomboid family serine protease